MKPVGPTVCGNPDSQRASYHPPRSMSARRLAPSRAQKPSPNVSLPERPPAGVEHSSARQPPDIRPGDPSDPPGPETSSVRCGTQQGTENAVTYARRPPAGRHNPSAGLQVYRVATRGTDGATLDLIGPAVVHRPPLPPSPLWSRARAHCSWGGCGSASRSAGFQARVDPGAHAPR